MTTSISNKAVISEIWNSKKYVKITENWNGVRENRFSMFLHSPFVAWPTDKIFIK